MRPRTGDQDLDSFESLWRLYSSRARRPLSTSSAISTVIKRRWSDRVGVAARGGGCWTHVASMLVLALRHRDGEMDPLGRLAVSCVIKGSGRLRRREAAGRTGAGAACRAGESVQILTTKRQRPAGKLH